MVVRKAQKVISRPPPKMRKETIIIENEFAPVIAHSRTATTGGRVKEARVNKSLTQLQLSKIAGLQRSAIAQWERDDSMPSIQMCRRIAPALGVTPEWLAFGIDYKPIINLT